MLSGCNDVFSLVFGPTDEEQAASCGVSVQELKATKARVKSMQPYGGADLGRCGVIKDDSGVVVGFKGNELVPEGVRPK